MLEREHNAARDYGHGCTRTATEHSIVERVDSYISADVHNAFARSVSVRARAVEHQIEDRLQKSSLTPLALKHIAGRAARAHGGDKEARHVRFVAGRVSLGGVEVRMIAGVHDQ